MEVLAIYELYTDIIGHTLPSLIIWVWDHKINSEFLVNNATYQDSIQDLPILNKWILRDMNSEESFKGIINIYAIIYLCHVGSVAILFDSAIYFENLDCCILG